MRVSKRERSRAKEGVVAVLGTPVTNLHESVTVRWHCSAVICYIGARSIGYVKQVWIASVGCVESLRTVPGVFSTIPRLEIGQTASGLRRLGGALPLSQRHSGRISP